MLSPIALSLLLIAAHFLRMGYIALVVVAVGSIGLLAVRRGWAARIMQILLILTALVWGWTMSQYIEQYRAQGRDWRRMVIILSAVAAFTLASVLVFRLPPVRRRYFGGDHHVPDDSARV